MDALTLSRIQFAFTIGFHILWPAFTIGIASFVAFLSFWWWRTGNPVYGALMRFWIHIFALGFGMGVVTGLVLSYQIGTNWSGFSRAVSNVLGPFFMYEVMTAFFLEAGFIGIVIFGEKRVGRGAHFFACLMVATGTLFSASWILASNSWMQTPAGYTLDSEGVFHVTDWWAAFFNPSFPYRFLHMICASYITGSFVVAGVSAYHLWRREHVEVARKGFSLAMGAALVLVPLQLVIGDAHGRNTMRHQPTKLAAMEGLWDSGSGVAATLIAWPDMEGERNRFEIAIPHAASLYLTHSWNGYVQGLKAVPAADRPYVPLVFFAFRIMVGIGIVLLILAIVGGVLRWRGRLFTTRWFQLAAMAATPLGFIAVIAGWTVTETGRQPYVVYGHLRTADAVAPIAPGAVLTSLVMFFLVYNVLLLAFFWYGARIVVRGPSAIPNVHPNAVRPGLEQAGTAVLSRATAPPASIAAGE
ncbi:cytochrome ubiquinol oxidase subunit I [Methylobacterium sp. Leaf118]|uniref:cytochrome ubiquinol oxidase subunit I n=1 Tax=Methylobacterium sp. Leaf118 TaxID=2876562 RepID=UPI001E2DA42A|nr:cytochrome ubiquinol oxidase subunit I [Methylobacterium sp. Leaf118]